MEKSCVSCGMPLQNTEDFPLGDTSKDFCLHCARPDGEMKSYDEALTGMTAFICQSQGLDESAAREAAKKLMAKLPAWRDR